MLYGCRKLGVFTDHKNLTYENLTSKRVLHWRLYIEEFAPQFFYVPGSTTTLPDALSCLPHMEGQSTAVNGPLQHPENSILNEEEGQSPAGYYVHNTEHPTGTNKEDKYSPSEMTSFQSCIEDTSMLTCFQAFPTVHYHQPFVLDNRTMAQQQAQVVVIQEQINLHPEQFRHKTTSDDVELVYHLTPGTPPKIYFPAIYQLVILGFREPMTQSN
jgi:hypothetical protein